MTPRFIRNNIKTRLAGRNANHVIEEARKRLMRLEIRSHYAKIDLMRAEAYSLHLRLMKELHPIVWEAMLKMVWEDVKENGIRKRARMKRKFEALVRENTKRDSWRRDDERENFIINKSSHVLTSEETQLLKKGLKYQPRPKAPPMNNIIASIETSIRWLEGDRKAVVRDEICGVLEETRNIRAH